MAKVGEGDTRWIVADREDGTNVHNWHWAEKNVTSWARSRLTALLGNLDLSPSGKDIQASTSSLIEVKGDAVVNNRKNKLIPAYELEVTGSWSGSLTKGSSEAVAVSGQWKVPYLAEENADEDPEVTFATATDDSAHQRAKATLLGVGREAIHAKLREFVKEINAGRPIKTDGNAQPASQAAEKSTSSQQPSPSRSKAQLPNLGKFKTFRAVEKFYARPADIYECFTSAERIHAFTQSPAKVEAKEGGSFEMFGGSVVGKYKKLSTNSKLVLDWRFRNWQEKDISKVEISLEEPEPGTTILTLEHSSIPEEDQFGNEDVYETTAAGWKQQIFHRIRAVFGYGLGL